MLRGPGRDEKLTGVLVATMRDPSGRGPGARLSDGPGFQAEAGFGNGQPAPSLPPGPATRPALSRNVPPPQHGSNPSPREPAPSPYFAPARRPTRGPMAKWHW